MKTTQNTNEQQQNQKPLRTIQNDEKIPLTNDKLLAIREKEFTFTNKDNTTRKVNRKLYEYEKETIIIPITLHQQIEQYQTQYKEKLISIIAKKTGTGINTKYYALPQITT